MARKQGEGIHGGGVAAVAANPAIVDSEGVQERRLVQDSIVGNQFGAKGRTEAHLRGPPRRCGSGGEE
jgi:hypothetical protein